MEAVGNHGIGYVPLKYDIFFTIFLKRVKHDLHFEVVGKKLGIQLLIIVGLAQPTNPC